MINLQTRTGTVSVMVNRWQVCTEDEYKRLEKAFFEKENNLRHRMPARRDCKDNRRDSLKRAKGAAKSAG